MIIVLIVACTIQEMTTRGAYRRSTGCCSGGGFAGGLFGDRLFSGKVVVLSGSAERCERAGKFLGFVGSNKGLDPGKSYVFRNATSSPLDKSQESYERSQVCV